jgi:hypothetical protein
MDPGVPREMTGSGMQWAAKNAEDRRNCGQSTDPGVPRQMIGSETNSRGRLQESVKGNRPELWPNKRILHQNNVPAQAVLRVCQLVTIKPITKMDQPPYSPDFAPATSGSFQN